MKATEDEIAALIEQLRDDGMAAYHVHDHVGQQLGIIGAPALSPLLRAMQDPDASVRQGAAQALGRIGGPETVAALMVALADPSDDVRQESALTLGGLGDPSAGQALAAALEDDEPLVREAAAVSLGSLGGTGGVDALVRTLADESADVASAAAFSLCRLGWPGAVETILTLSQRNPEEDEGYGFGDYGFFDEALSALTEAGTSAVPACLAALSHENLMVRRVAIKVLGGSSDPRAVEPLMACLTDADPAVRAGGADALAQMGLPEVVDALLAALDASNDKLRLMAVEVLGQSGDERAIEPLHALKSEEGTPLARAVVEAVGRLVPPDIETLIAALKDPKEAVRRDAAQALAWRGDVRAAGPLLDALDDPATRCWAIHALGNLREARAVEPLCRLLQEGEWNVRRSAAVALWEIGDVRSTEVLLPALEDEESSVREYAALALGRLQEPCAIEPLLGLLWNDSDCGVRSRAARALGAIGAPTTRADLRAAWFDRDINVFWAAQDALERFGDASLCAPSAPQTNDATSPVTRQPPR